MDPKRRKTLSLILLNNGFYFMNNFLKKRDKENIDRVRSRNGLTGVTH